MANVQRGEFDATINGVSYNLNTQLATLAAIENAALASRAIGGQENVLDVYNGAVRGIARHGLALIEGLLAGAGTPAKDAAKIAASATREEVAALCEGFFQAAGLVPVKGGPAVPLDGTISGESGAVSA